MAKKQRIEKADNVLLQKLKKTKRNPNDATMRNVRAAKKRTQSLESRVKNLEIGMQGLLDTLVANYGGRGTVWTWRPK